MKSARAWIMFAVAIDSGDGLAKIEAMPIVNNATTATAATVFGYLVTVAFLVPRVSTVWPLSAVRAASSVPVAEILSGHQRPI